MIFGRSKALGFDTREDRDLRRIGGGSGRPAASADTSDLLRLGTAIPSKGIGLLVQVIAIPIVYGALGPARFAAYAAVAAAVSVLSFLNLGMGGALVTPLAQAGASQDHRREANLLGATLIPLGILAISALCIALPLLSLLPLDALFGQVSTAMPSKELRTAVLLACIGTIVAIPLSLVDSARQAYQEIHISNVFATVSSMAVFFGLLLAAWFAPRLPAFVVVTAVAPLGVGLLNSGLLVIRRPYLIAMRLGEGARALIGQLATDGLSYMVAAALASALLYQWPIYYMARVRPATESATFAVYTQLILLALSFGISLAQPLWAAVADATAGKDYTWIVGVLQSARTAALLFGGCVLLLFGFGMNAIIKIWLHRQIRVSPLACWLAGAYLLLAVWEYVHWPFALGLGKMRAASHLVLLRAAVVSVIIPFAARYGEAGIMALQCTSVVLISGWYYPRLLRNALHRCPMPGINLTAQKQHIFNTT